MPRERVDASTIVGELPDKIADWDNAVQQDDEYLAVWLIRIRKLGGCNNEAEVCADG